MCVFDTDAGLRLVRERMARHPRLAEFAPQIFGKTLADLRQDFVDGCQHLGGEKRVPLFQ